MPSHTTRRWCLRGKWTEFVTKDTVSFIADASCVIKFGNLPDAHIVDVLCYISVITESKKMKKNPVCRPRTNPR